MNRSRSSMRRRKMHSKIKKDIKQKKKISMIEAMELYKQRSPKFK